MRQGRCISLHSKMLLGGVYVQNQHFLQNEANCCERLRTCCNLQQSISGALQISIILHM